MKKVLLIGELNQTLSSVNEHFSNSFQTQICMDKIELVRGMLKVFIPDMVLICLVGVGKLDNRILSIFSEQYSKVPVLLLGTTAECNYFQKYYESEQFDFMIRPTKMSDLFSKALVMLGMEEAEPVQGRKMEKTENALEERKLIMAIDDNGILLRSVKSILESHFDVTLATSGMMALKKAQKQVPDLILLDYEMPEWDGKRTLEEIRNDETLKEVPVVFLTAKSDKEHIMSVLNLKPSGYLLKPIDSEKLIDTIEKVLSGVL